MKGKDIVAKKISALKGDSSTLSFARFCDIPESTLRSYLKGAVKNPQIPVLKKIAAACNVPWQWLALDSKLPIPPEWKMSEISDENLEKILNLDPEVIDIDRSGNSIIPVVRAYDDEKVHLLFYCIHCGVWHFHGRGGGGYPFTPGRGGMAGHRITHCHVSNSPYKPHGIILDVVGKYSELDDKRKNHKTPICKKCRNYYSSAFNACECGSLYNSISHPAPELEEFYKNLFDPLRVANIQTGAIDEQQLETTSEEDVRETLEPAVSRTQKGEPKQAGAEPESPGENAAKEFRSLCIGMLEPIIEYIAESYGTRPSDIERFKADFVERMPEYQLWLHGEVGKKRAGGCDKDGPSK